MVTQDAGSSLVRGIRGPSATQYGTSPIGSTTISDGSFERDGGDGIFLELAFNTIGVNTDLTSGYIGNSGSGVVGIAFGRSPINAYTWVMPAR